MYKHTLIGFVFCIVFYLHPGSYEDNDWVRVVDRDGITVDLHTEWKSTLTYRAQGSLPVSREKLFLFLTDVGGYTDWVNGCTVSVLLEKKPGSYVYYSYYDLPWPLQDRDAVSRVTLREVGNGIVAEIEAVNTDTLTADGALRIKNFSERHVLIQTGENTTLMKMQGSYDPGGYLPGWVIKKFLTWGPYDTLLAIRRQLKKQPGVEPG